jgi:hypothetical protein
MLTLFNEILCRYYIDIGCSFKCILKVGVESIVNAPQIIDHGSSV